MYKLQLRFPPHHNTATMTFVLYLFTFVLIQSNQVEEMRKGRGDGSSLSFPKEEEIEFPLLPSSPLLSQHLLLLLPLLLLPGSGLILTSPRDMSKRGQRSCTSFTEEKETENRAELLSLFLFSSLFLSFSSSILLFPLLPSARMRVLLPVP